MVRCIASQPYTFKKRKRKEEKRERERREKEKEENSKLGNDLFPFFLSFFAHLVAVVVVWYFGQVLSCTFQVRRHGMV